MKLQPFGPGGIMLILIREADRSGCGNRDKTSSASRKFYFTNGNIFLLFFHDYVIKLNNFQIYSKIISIFKNVAAIYD